MVPPIKKPGDDLKQLSLLRSDPRIAAMVEDCLVLRLPQRTIVSRLMQNGIDEDRAKKFIRAVLRQWERQHSRGSNTRKAHMRATLEGVFTQAMANKKFQAATQVLRELIRLDGLAEPDRLRVDVSTMTIETAVLHIEESHGLIALARQRGVIEATASTVPPPVDEGSSGNGGGETH